MHNFRLHPAIRIFLSVIFIGSIVVAFFIYRWYTRSGGRAAQVIATIRDRRVNPGWNISAGAHCNEAPFSMPTNGFIGFIWDDSFRPGHRHQGLDMFGLDDPGVVPVYAAYAGYLTRLPDWKSTVIIRIPSDPLRLDRQIWNYYTHMAEPDGTSYIVDAFPPGTSEVYVEEGTLLGYQGNFSGDPNNPTGVHLHFSIVKDDGTGSFLNELDIKNTLDPSPYFGMPLNANENPDEVPVCEE
jgi:hypothetical protein